MRAGRIRRRTRRQVLAAGLSFQKIHGGRKMKNRRKKTAAAAAALMIAGLLAVPAAAAPQTFYCGTGMTPRGSQI